MCGIAGWLGHPELAGSPEATIDRMLQRIRHRGPDGHGTALLPFGYFAHVRLAVIDPVGGVQPMWSADRSHVLVFNGEIYNFREIRENLSRSGVEWRTQSDSEVVLHLLRLEGADGLSRLRGMYALAFWDNVRSHALLARDPNGIKPLFLRREGDTLWFASEAKAFPPTASWSPALDEGRLHMLLNLRYPAAGSGLFRDVEQLAPGHCLQWSAGSIRERPIPDRAPRPVIGVSIRDSLLDSVRAHLVADVPVGCYLSGGIDSALVTYGAAIASRDRTQTFTIEVGDDPDEARNAAATASWLGVPNSIAALAPANDDALTWLLWHVEVPKINALQSAAVAQLASQMVKVCLSGLGGDELFFGYRAHRQFASACSAATLMGPFARPLGVLLSWWLGRHHEFSEPWRATAMLRFGNDVPRIYALLRNVWEGSVPRQRIYGPRMLDQPLPDALDWIRSRWPATPSPVSAMAEFEWRNKMVDDLLWQEDRISMAFGLEARVPFVDQNLQQVLLGFEPELARQPGTKSVLKRAFADTVPAAILARPKSGFQLDIARIYDTTFGAIQAEWLSAARVRRHGLFNPAFVDMLQGLPRTRRHRWHFFLLLLMAQTHRWIELFESGEAMPPATPALISEPA